jgi:hypothetical protein
VGLAAQESALPKSMACSPRGSEMGAADREKAPRRVDLAAARDDLSAIRC